MNLVEQLGGYEQANSKLLKMDKILKEVYYSHSNAQKADELRQAILEYRRQHNIFEKGDPIVFDISKPFCAKLQPDLMEVINPTYQEHDMIVRIDNQIYVVGGKAVRHATDAEIKAGKRLGVDSE